MKKLIIACTMLFFGSSALAQAWNGKGDQKIQIGLNGYGYGTGITGTYDYGLSKLVSVGAGANIYFSDYKDNDDKNNVFIFGRLNVHLQEPLGMPEKWDIYPGVDLGVLGSGFGIGAHIGVRYYFTPKVGIYLEAGNNGSIGVSLNL